MSNETDKDKRYEALGQFVNAVINKNEEEINSSMSSYLQSKAREILGTTTPVVERDTSKEVGKDDDDKDEDEKGKDFLKNRDKRKAPLKKMKKTDESVISEFVDGSPIRLKGNDVFVDNKLVGVIENDLNNADTGIVFKSNDGKKAQEFGNIQELYQFLVTEFEVAGE